MNISRPTFLILLLAATTLSAQSDWAPQYPSLDRYKVAWENNPFDRNTASAAEPEFAKNLSLTGISRIGDKWTVLVVNQQTSKYLALGSEDNGSGIWVTEVFPHNDRRQATAKVTNGSQEALLSFDRESRPSKTTKPPAPPKKEEPVNPTRTKLRLRLPEAPNKKSSESEASEEQ